jgi:Protein of unknown function (DUF3455)
MKRRIFASLAAAAAVTASVLITSQASAADAPPALSATNTAAQSAGVTPNSQLPPDLQITDSTLNVVAALRGVGKQVYDCDTTAKKYVFREPMAGLFTSRGIPVGIHDAIPGTGPFWSNLDGSKVVGSTSTANPDFKSVAAPNSARDINWLKIPAINNFGVGGTFSNVKFIQRIDTRGGQPPTSCTTPSTVAVDYTTNYVFWGK